MRKGSQQDTNFLAHGGITEGHRAGCSNGHAGTGCSSGFQGATRQGGPFLPPVRADDSAAMMKRGEMLNHTAGLAAGIQDEDAQVIAKLETRNPGTFSPYCCGVNEILSPVVSSRSFFLDPTGGLET